MGGGGSSVCYDGSGDGGGGAGGGIGGWVWIVIIYYKACKTYYKPITRNSLCNKRCNVAVCCFLSTRSLTFLLVVMHSPPGSYGTAKLFPRTAIASQVLGSNRAAPFVPRHSGVMDDIRVKLLSTTEMFRRASGPSR